MMIWLWLVLLLCCSGFISASETALFGLNRRVLHEFGRSHGSLRRRVHRLMLTPGSVLMTVLLANTAVNVGIFAVSFVALRGLGETHRTAEVFGGLAVLVTVIVFGEILPKTCALSHAHRFAPAAGVLITLLKTALAPLRWVLRTMFVTPIVRLITPARPQSTTVTQDELGQLVELSARDGIIGSKEQDMLQAIVAAGHVSVREIMTPRVDMHALEIDKPRQTAVCAMLKGRRHLVVYGKDLDDIRGVVYARDLSLHSDIPVKELVRPIRFIPEQTKLVQLLRYLRSANTELAVVVDEYGGTSGFVSFEHVIDWIIGGAGGDQAAEAPAAERIDDNTYRVLGNLSARLWADRFGAERVDRHIDTVGGLILSRLGRIPTVGDSVRIGNLSLTVEEMNNRRIEWIVLHRDVEGESPKEIYE
jgi:putative hemolysin